MAMMLIILSVMLIGLILVVLEIIFIPGTTVVGLLGLVFSIAGIVVTYQYYGPAVGLYVLIASSILKLALLYFSLTAKPWKRFSLKSSIHSRVNENMFVSLRIGDTGKTMSTLRPVGKAVINDQEYEVRTFGNSYVESGIPVRIASIGSNQIIVEPTK